jgi:hypothetical protein
VQECANFPAGAHDDQVDAMSQALLRLRQAALPFGWFDDDAQHAQPAPSPVAAAAVAPGAPQSPPRYTPTTEDDWQQRDDDLPWWAAT